MHIPDAYLSPQTQIAGFAVSAPIVGLALAKTRKSLSSRQVPLLSVGAAFCFALQMFNIPALGGTSAHALGTVLLTVLLGPWAAMVTITLNLMVQALFFGDGGILSLGVNVWDMAIIPAFVGQSLYSWIGSRSEVGSGKVSPRRLTAAAVAAYAGTSIASLSAGLILGLQPLVAHDASGHGLYFPFGWAISVPAMVTTHLLIAAPAEAIVTVVALSYLWRNFPDLVGQTRAAPIASRVRLIRTLAFVLVLTPLGLIAGGDAWGEWDMETLKSLVGYVPAGVAKSHELIHPLLPDYALPNIHGVVWDVAGYVLSAVVGALLVIVATRSVFRVASTVPTPSNVEPSGFGPSADHLPNWLCEPNPVRPGSGRTDSRVRTDRWLDKLLVGLRGALAETQMREDLARRPGLLQSTPAALKAVIALGLLIAATLARQPWLLAVILLTVAYGVIESRVTLGRFFRRVGYSVAFFGAVVACPLVFQRVTPGNVVVGQGIFAISGQGLHSACLLLLRLGCAISITLLWTMTTGWNDLVRSIRTLGVPAVVCTGIALSYRYLFVTLQTLEEMAIARRSRQIGAMSRDAARSYAGTGMAILFDKSFALTEEIHMAMRSRGFEVTPVRRRSQTAFRVVALTASGGLLILLLMGLNHAI